MPFVRYARDRRGYETLYVMHAFEGAEGTGPQARSPRPRVLYACRTVPYAKVGRMTIDESVQRRIESAYPNLTFDWPRLLKEAAQSAPRPERPDSRPERKGKGRKKGEPRVQAPKVPRVPQVPQVPQVPEVRFAVPQVQEVQEVLREPLGPVTELIEWSAEAEPEPEPSEPGTEPGEPPEPVEPVEPMVPVVLSVPPLVVDPSWPVVRVAGPDRALILRGRYIEIASRVLSRVPDEAEQRRLFHDARRLNPETWTTDEQAHEGLGAFEEVYARLAEQLRRQRPV